MQKKIQRQKVALRSLGIQRFKLKKKISKKNAKIMALRKSVQILTMAARTRDRKLNTKNHQKCLIYHN